MAITLRPGEEVKFEVNFHWSVFLFAKLWAVVGIFAVIGGFFHFFTQPNSGGVELGMIAFIAVIFFAPFLYRWLQNKNKIYLVTTQRFYVEEGILSKSQREIPLNKINDLTMRQSILQRIFGSGNIILLTGNDVGIALKDIDNPEQFKLVIGEVVQRRTVR